MFIYPTQQCGTVPFYRLFSQGLSDHFYTTNETERNSALGAGYQDEGVEGYVFAATPSTSRRSVQSHAERMQRLSGT